MTIQPGNRDLQVVQGATLIEVLTWKDSTGALVNLTGYTAKMMARATFDSPTPFLTLSTTDATIVLGGAAGTITLKASAAVTAALASLPGVYDLFLTDSSGNATCLLQGKFIVGRDVTR